MITFTNSAVLITGAFGPTGQFSGFNLLASDVSISTQNNRRGTKRLGSPGFYSQVMEGPAAGSLSLTYYMTDTDADVRNLLTGMVEPGTGIQLFDVHVGKYRCYSGVVNSLTMSIDPYAPVSCSLDISFYNGYDQLGDFRTLNTPGDVIHGGVSQVDTTLLWGSDLAGCEYSMSQDIAPVYALGELTPSGYTREGGSLEVALDGTGLGHILDFSGICSGYTTGNITLTGLCEGTVGGSIPFSGYVTNPSITVAPNSEINGSLTIFDVF